jgi:hypothetical protein
MRGVGRTLKDGLDEQMSSFLNSNPHQKLLRILELHPQLAQSKVDFW